MKNSEIITWSVPEYKHKKRSIDWYVALGIIGVTSSVASFILENILFGILILIGIFTLAIYGVREPKIMEVELNKRGVFENNKIYPFNTLKSFWVEEYSEEPKIIIQSEKPLMPYIIIPIGNMDPDKIRDFLNKHLDEEEHYEPLSHKLMEYLGF